ncbi:hypothetical protein CGLO_15549 [Colletotrichum gloeosporioides Cg-14]|uniref:Uncharacterized protein n=1 Tax=Colletotrichum gloeosporioides (strain Cg-14) TaxID=1237896 RepID=T0JQR6_COLGC|nr:hypothetical protein CGLO_15549 [Colletotrichum gloeosporioides Cg-14]
MPSGYSPTVTGLPPSRALSQNMDRRP